MRLVVLICVLAMSAFCWAECAVDYKSVHAVPWVRSARTTPANRVRRLSGVAATFGASTFIPHVTKPPSPSPPPSPPNIPKAQLNQGACRSPPSHMTSRTLLL